MRSLPPICDDQLEAGIHSYRWTVEGTRYVLLREGVPHSDGNFSHGKLVRYLNAELADTLGNTPPPFWNIFPP
jgi:hypothetical protein